MESQIENLDKIMRPDITDKIEESEIKYIWKNITDEFKEACNVLELGELMHDSHFSLFEGMSAIEMMDPKMDALMTCNQTKRKVYTYKQAIEVGDIKLENFTSEEFIGIIDDSLSCLITWLEGHSLAQTVFINLYLHDPMLILDPYLKSFSICFLKLIDLIRKSINKAGVYEEEDFHSMSYKFNLAFDIQDQVALQNIKEAEEHYNKITRNTRNRKGVKMEGDTVSEHDLANALSSRLKFTRLFYSYILAISKDKCQGIPEAEKYQKQISELLDTIISTSLLGSSRSSDPDCPFLKGFEPLVNQKLLPPSIPRLAKIKTRKESEEYLIILVKRFGEILNVVQLSNLHDIIDFFLEFSKPSPCILSRSLLQLLLLPSNRKIFGKEIISDSIKETIKSFCAPAALMPKSILYNNTQCKDCIDAFVVQAARPLLSMIQVAGHNRARQRDKWVRILEDMSLLQLEAEKVDSFIQSIMLKYDQNWQICLNFGTWVIYITLRIMIYFLSSGFELELYSVHEYNYIFWYMSEGLYNWLSSTLNRADNFVHEVDSSIMVKGNTKKNKKKKKSRINSSELTIAQALHSLTGGYYKAVMGLKMDDKLKQPKFDFDSEGVRYNHRLAPFGLVTTPPPFHYVQFKEITDFNHYNPNISPVDLYNSASKCFYQAKVYLESISSPKEEVTTLLQISKTNLVVMRILSGGHKKDSKKAPEFDFSLHKIFPIIKLL